MNIALLLVDTGEELLREVYKEVDIGPS